MDCCYTPQRQAPATRAFWLVVQASLPHLPALSIATGTLYLLISLVHLDNFTQAHFWVRICLLNLTSALLALLLNLQLNQSFAPPKRSTSPLSTCHALQVHRHQATPHLEVPTLFSPHISTNNPTNSTFSTLFRHQMLNYMLGNNTKPIAPYSCSTTRS